MGLLHGIRFWRRKWVVLTALAFPAGLTGKHVEISVTTGQIFLPGWCPCKLMPPSFLPSSSMQPPPPSFSTNQRRTALAEEDGGWQGLAALFPRPEWHSLGIVTEACSWLCLEDHQEPGSSSGRNSFLEMPSWGNGSGQGRSRGQKDRMQGHNIPRKSPNRGKW